MKLLKHLSESDPELDNAASYERQTIIDHRRKEQFVDSLSDTPPEGCDLKVGDWVRWENDNGVEWEHQVLGFEYGSEYGDRYGAHIILDKDSYWFPLHHGELTKIDAPSTMVNKDSNQVHNSKQ